MINTHTGRCHQFNIPIIYDDDPMTVDWRCGLCGKGWLET